MHSPYEDEVDLHQVFMQAKNADFLQFRIVFWEDSDDDRGLKDVPPSSLSISVITTSGACVTSEECHEKFDHANRRRVCCHDGMR